MFDPRREDEGPEKGDPSYNEQYAAAHVAEGGASQLALEEDLEATGTPTASEVGRDDGVVMAALGLSNSANALDMLQHRVEEDGP